MTGVALDNAGKRGVVLLVGLVVSLALIYQATTLWLAWNWGHSSELSKQIRGAKLTPEDAEAWDRIGEALSSNFDAPPTEAIAFFQRAVKADPRSARDWMDLAQAYEIGGDVSQAKAAYQEAKQAYPASAEVSWKYGNFLLREGEMAQGLEEVHRALVTDPRLVPLAISRIWILEPDVRVILQNVLPPGENVRFEALDFFAERRENAAALETWHEITDLAKTRPVRIDDTFPFLRELVSTDQTEEAERVWHEALTAARWPGQTASGDSPIWNGGFEEPIVNGGLGWRIEQVPGAYVSTDSTVFHSGQKSLRVDFTGGVNLDFSNVQQNVPVEPNTHYVFQYFMRTDSISTESGIRFEVLDLNDYQVNVMTPDLTGTNPWTPVQVDVTTGRSTHFLDIRLRRLPSRLFDNKLSGTVWVDDVSLMPQSTANSGTHP
jgi:tetratricopeptide (TPR) repeat protein